MIEQIEDKESKRAIARKVLEALRDWFEVDESREKYIAESADQIFLAAKEDDEYVGFLCLKETGKETVELAVMGVLREYHRGGLGRKLFEEAKRIAAETGYEFMQVKTVQMGMYDDYDRTNRFYLACGFREFEVIKELWGEENPCQIYVMSLMDERRRNIKLVPVTKEDVKTVWKMQVQAFADLLEKYRDFEISPGAESLDKVSARFEQPWTTYFFIMANDEKVGVIRIVDKKDGSRKRISPVWIMKDHRNKGYAQRAISEAEKIYGPDHWCLDTILQEEGNLHLYEKLGYHRTGRIDKINDRMDIVYYEK